MDRYHLVQDLPYYPIGTFSQSVCFWIIGSRLPMLNLILGSDVMDQIIEEVLSFLTLVISLVEDYFFRH